MNLDFLRTSARVVILLILVLQLGAAGGYVLTQVGPETLEELSLLLIGGLLSALGAAIAFLFKQAD